MMLELKEVLVTPDAKAECHLTLDMTNFTRYDQKPITQPVQVDVTVKNRGGALVMDGKVSSPLSFCCDRCLTSFVREKEVMLHSLLADHLEDEENDEIILLEGTCLNVEEVATTAFILEMDTKTLCSEQCQGLCPTCGVNLNEGNCTCQVVSDSPFAKLAQLLDD